MSNIDKHTVRAVADLKAGYTLGHADVAILNELARIALASLEAEAVAWRYRFVHTPKSEEHGSPFTTDWVLTHCEDDCNPSDCFERQPLYTEPPAPVSVPEKLPCDLENEWSMVDEFNKKSHIPDEKVKGDDFELDGPLSCYQAGKIDGWNEYRAAMLQSFGNSEQLNSPGVQGGWVACSERMPEKGQKVFYYFDIVGVHAGYYDGDNTFVKENGGGWLTGDVTHWMEWILPAAPQQE
ncbi:DUF551 domain-containing protein [Enterobacter cloacae]|uniref:DUF551 domain-containing protein n=1 Tax=Enterobacter cloacae TaxID=550 RepID=UPI002FD64DDB